MSSSPVNPATAKAETPSEAVPDTDPPSSSDPDSAVLPAAAVFPEAVSEVSEAVRSAEAGQAADSKGTISLQDNTEEPVREHRIGFSLIQDSRTAPRNTGRIPRTP